MSSNYGRQIQRDYECAIIRVEELTRDNAVLRREVREWEEKYASLEARVEAIIEQAIVKATAPLLVEIATLKEENIKLRAEVARLKAQINKDSTNSSTPPSRNGYKKIPNNREVSGRKIGGQIGHEGHCLSLPGNLDELAARGEIELIDIDNSGGSEQWRYTYTVDFKIINVITRCKQALNTTVPYLAYGINVKVFSLLLHCKEFVAQGRVSEIISYLTGGMITPQTSTINNFIDQASEMVDRRYEEIKQDVLNSEILHTDETPVRSTVRQEIDENGASVLRIAIKTTYNVFFRVYCTLRSVFFTLNAHKGDAGVVSDGVLPQYVGILVHDHDAKLYKYGSAHATCNAHLLRDLKGLWELWKFEWAERFRILLLEMNAHKQEDISGSESYLTCCDTETYDKYATQWDALVAEGMLLLAQMQPGDFGYNELRRMVNRLKNYKSNHMLFLSNYEVPFTNNLAERELRACKVKENVSKTFRSWSGAERYAKISTVIATALRRNESPFSLLASLFVCGAE